MKKMLMIIMALAMVAAFMPKAYAAESAQLGLSVTFAVDQDLQRVQELKAEVSAIASDVKAVGYRFDVDHDGVFGDSDIAILLRTGDFNGDGKVDDNDIAYVNQTIKDLSDLEGLKLKPIIDELNTILKNRPDLQSVIQPVIADAQNVYNSIENYTQLLMKLLPVISIELNESAWKLDGVKLGEKRSNLNDLGLPIHMVRNTGNVQVMVDIRYAPGLIYLEWAPRPGLQQGPNTFTTETANGVIPPDGKVAIANITPGNSCGVRLTYGAPTSVESVATGGPITSMSTEYEIRAYPAKVLPVDPNQPILQSK